MRWRTYGESCLVLWVCAINPILRWMSWHKISTQRRGRGLAYISSIHCLASLVFNFSFEKKEEDALYLCTHESRGPHLFLKSLLLWWNHEYFNPNFDRDYSVLPWSYYNCQKKICPRQSSIVTWLLWLMARKCIIKSFWLGIGGSLLSII